MQGADEEGLDRWGRWGEVVVLLLIKGKHPRAQLVKTTVWLHRPNW